MLDNICTSIGYFGSLGLNFYHALGKFNRRQINDIFFSYFSQETEFDTSSKLSPMSNSVPWYNKKIS